MPPLVLTQANINFIKANRLLMSGAAMAKKFGVSKSAVNSYMRKNGLTASKELSNKLKGIAHQKPFTLDEDKYITENITTKSIKQIGKHLKRTSQYISKRCREIGLADILDAKAQASKYVIGSIPKNKGKKQTEYMSNTLINWQQKKCGDWFANPECGYMLIVEKLDDGYSWQLNHQGDIVDDSWLIGDRNLNRTQAFTKAESAFKKYYKQFSTLA